VLAVVELEVVVIVEQGLVNSDVDAGFSHAA